VTVLEIPTPDPRTFDDSSRPFVEAVGGRYAIKKLIGRGGMGIVYLARDRRLERLVAIKTLPPHLAADEGVRQRFLRETRMAGALSHSNIVPVHGADELDGHAFFVMGFVDGDSLAAHVRAEGRLEPRRVAEILRDVAGAIDHAHTRGIIHRDIKAENILIERATGRAMVTDFGIARLAEAAPITATGQMLGTVHYVSPEQVCGDPIDGRSDLYSLGVVGFLALSGTFPFDAELASAVLVAHVNKPAPPLRSVRPTVPATLASIVDRCLAKEPARRYQSARELVLALESAIRALDAGETRGDERALVSETEAHAVWKRAAELQAETGVHARPAQVRLVRNEEVDRARSSGFRVDDIRDAGREAGIDTQFLNQALAERGLVARPAINAPVEQRSLWAGVPLDLTRRVEIEGEIQQRDFDRLLRILRVGTGQVGTTMAQKRELAWRCDSSGYALDVSIVPAEGTTTVHMTKSLRRMAVKMLTATLAAGTFVGSLTGLLTWQFIQSPTPGWLRELGLLLQVSRGGAELLTIGVGVLAGIAVIPMGRGALRWLHGRSRAQLDALTEAVASNVHGEHERPPLSS
jgi:predicted Ser/Thr protein kinase